jgi:hypothetical protein
MPETVSPSQHPDRVLEPADRRATLLLEQLQGLMAGLEEKRSRSVSPTRWRRRCGRRCRSSAIIGWRSSSRDVDSTFMKLSRSMFAMLGLPTDRKSMSRDELYEYVHTDDRERIRATIEQAVVYGIRAVPHARRTCAVDGRAVHVWLHRLRDVRPVHQRAWRGVHRKAVLGRRAGNEVRDALCLLTFDL